MIGLKFTSYRCTSITDETTCRVCIFVKIVPSFKITCRDGSFEIVVYRPILRLGPDRLRFRVRKR